MPGPVLGTEYYLTSEVLNLLILLKCLAEQPALSQSSVNDVNDVTYKTISVVIAIIIPMLLMRFGEVKPPTQVMHRGRSGAWI